MNYRAEMFVGQFFNLNSFILSSLIDPCYHKRKKNTETVIYNAVHVTLIFLD